MSIDAAIAELMRSPAFFDHIAALQGIAADEQRRREQFYNDLDEDSQTEFINGQIVIHSPAPREHIQAAYHISVLLGQYAEPRGLGKIYPGKCVIRCQRNDYEPDVCFFGTTKCAGMVQGQKVFPPPDLLVEVLSPSTERNDRTLKLQDYARHGIGEYWIVDADELFVEQYVLPAGSTEYKLKARLPDGARLSSTALPGFEVSVAAFFDPQERQP